MAAPHQEFINPAVFMFQYEEQVGLEGGDIPLIKSVDLTTEAAKCGSYREDKGLKGVLLSIKHGGSKQRIQNAFGSYVGNKKIKMLSYDRYAVFGDLMDPPNTFAVFLTEAKESRSFFESSRFICVVGTIFYFTMPNESKTKFRETTPILSFQDRCIPLAMGRPPVLFQELVPPSPIATPKDSNSSLFFVLHGTTIHISMFRVSYDTSCTGEFCDRAHLELAKATACACFATRVTRTPTVAEFSVRLLEAPRNPIEIPFFRSYRTSGYFFENITRFALGAGKGGDDRTTYRRGELRHSIRIMTDYVNANGGWTVIGWSRIGEVQDSSNPGEKMESSSANYHISLLVPTIPAIRDFLDPFFLGLRIPSDGPVQHALLPPAVPQNQLDEAAVIPVPEVVIVPVLPDPAVAIDPAVIPVVATIPVVGPVIATCDPPLAIPVVGPAAGVIPQAAQDLPPVPVVVAATVLAQEDRIPSNPYSPPKTNKNSRHGRNR